MAGGKPGGTGAGGGVDWGIGVVFGVSADVASVGRRGVGLATGTVGAARSVGVAVGKVGATKLQDATKSDKLIRMYKW